MANSTIDDTRTGDSKTGNSGSFIQRTRNLLLVAGLAAVVGGAVGAGITSAVTRTNLPDKSDAGLKPILSYDVGIRENGVIFEDSSGVAYLLRCSGQVVGYNGETPVMPAFLEPLE